MRDFTQGWRAEVVAQASFSWPFGPIHLLAPYEKSAAAQAAFPPAMRGQFRNALQGDPPAYGNGRPPHPAGAVPYNDLSVSA